MYRPRIFQPDLSSAITTAQNVTQISIHHLNSEYEKLARFLDQDEIIQAFRDYRAANASQRKEASVKVTSACHLLVSKVNAYCTFLDIKTSNRHIIITMKDISQLVAIQSELTKQDPSLEVLVEQYEMLKTIMRLNTLQIEIYLLKNNIDAYTEQARRDNQVNMCCCVS